MLTLTIQKTKTVWKGKLSFRDFRLHETLDTYSQMVDWVTAYCAAVRNLPAVTLKNPADWYTADFIRKYASCKAHTSQWTDNGILMKLIAIPQNIVNYDAMYQLYSQQIVVFAQTIISNPGSEIAKEAQKQLKLYLDSLRRSVQLYQGEIQEVQESLARFKGDVGSYKSFFEKLYQDSLDTKKADEELLEQYQAQIDTLQSDLKKWSDVQKGMYIAMGVEALIVPVSLGCGPFGFLVGLILGMGMIAEGITAVVANEKIQEDARKLAELNGMFDSYTLDASVLKELIDRMESLNQTLGHVEESLEGINQAWKQLEDNISQVLAALGKVDEVEEKELYKELIDLLKEADEEWALVVQAAKDVCLNAAQPELDQIYPAEVA
ncbi:MAG: HBL/NHE enterotoxin family protein [Clostridiales bacterium]|nr:HBL/NHE enterotoxin family protein [Clostridiales bacterium]